MKINSQNEAGILSPMIIVERSFIRGFYVVVLKTLT